MPQPSEWLYHFQTLHTEHQLNKEQNEILECVKTYENIKDSLMELDHVIHWIWTTKCSQRVKIKKAVHDKIRNEMIRVSIVTHSYVS